MRWMALVVVLPALAGAAIAAGDGAPKGSQFINSVGGGSFAFPSTKSGWDVKGPGKTKVVRIDREPNAQSSDPLDRQGLAVLWAKDCTAERQEVTFKREVFMAGPEHLLGAGIAMVHGPNGSLKSARLLVNGVKVLRVGPGGGGFDRTADRQRAFRFGTNEIEVIAVKKPAERRCNRSSAPDKVTGVSWNIFGEFAADVALPAQPREEYQRLSEGASGRKFQLAFEVRNNGPGGLARLPLVVEIDTPNTFDSQGHLLVIPEPEPPVESCTATPPAGQVSNAHRVVICTIANLRSGQTARQRMDVTWQMQGSANRAPMHVRWHAFPPNGEGPGADTTNNERSTTIWLCRHEDTTCPAP